jgi:hypothetical protein
MPTTQPCDRIQSDAINFPRKVSSSGAPRNRLGFGLPIHDQRDRRRGGYFRQLVDRNRPSRETAYWALNNALPCRQTQPPTRCARAITDKRTVAVLVLPDRGGHGLFDAVGDHTSLLGVAYRRLRIGDVWLVCATPLRN